MEIKMKTKLIRVFVGIVIGAFVCVTANAQDNKIRAAAGDKYVISAKAGGVNETGGDVTIRRADGTAGHLVKGDDLNIGDQVYTGTDGKAEVLLNPGSYMRVGSDTAFEFTTTSLDDLRLKLGSGSAIFEVIADDDFKVTVLMPRTAVALTRSGVRTAQRNWLKRMRASSVPQCETRWLIPSTAGGIYTIRSASGYLTRLAVIGALCRSATDGALLTDIITILISGMSACRVGSTISLRR